MTPFKVDCLSLCKFDKLYDPLLFHILEGLSKKGHGSKVACYTGW